MTDKELIKQEIERLYSEARQKKYNGEVEGEMCAYDKLISFIDSLPEEPDCEKKDYCERYEKLTQSDTFKSSYCDKSLGKEESTDEANCTRKSDDLEEEIDNYIKDNFFGSGSMGFFSNRTKQELNSIDVANIAHHFAEWQKEKMNLLLQTEYEKGLFDMREEIMKNTVLETEVLMDCDGDGIETPYEEWLTLEDTEIRCVPDGFKDGDIVKVILVKEDLP